MSSVFPITYTQTVHEKFQDSREYLKLTEICHEDTHTYISTKLMGEEIGANSELEGF